METDTEQDMAQEMQAVQEGGDQEQEQADNMSTTPPRSPSPELIPKLERVEQPATPPSATATPSPPPTPTPAPVLPKLRLNALLASDPALKPDAKELNLTEARMLGPPPQLIKPDPEPSSLVEPLLKPTRFMCLPCGIAFSSPSTLEAHQAYYCSHRNKETDEEAGTAGDKPGSGSSGSGSSSSGGTASNSASGAGSSSEPPAKVARTGKQYACTQCSYSADKKVSLNRHMRMHQTSPAAPPTSLPGLLPQLQQAANGIAGGGEESSSQVSSLVRNTGSSWGSSKGKSEGIPSQLIIPYLSLLLLSSPRSKSIATAATVISASTTSRRTAPTSSTTAAPGAATASLHPSRRA